MSQATFPDTEIAVEAGPTNFALLSEVAAKLLRLPFEERTKDLHIRALKLRRQLDLRDEAGPTDAELRATRRSILALRDEAEAHLAGR